MRAAAMTFTLPVLVAAISLVAVDGTVAAQTVCAAWSSAETPAAPPATPAPLPPRYLRTLAHDPGGYDPARGGGVTDLLLGDLLFHSPRTLGPAAQRLGLSCAACHPNGAAHGTLRLPPEISDRPGNVDLSTAYFRAGADNHVRDFVNIPSLRGVRFTPPYGRDGRTASLRELIGGVVEDEFGGAPLPPNQLRALLHYVQDLDFLPNHLLDARGHLTADASAAARRGERLFTMPRAAFDGGSCATCHPPSSFFNDGRTHRLGSGQPPSPHALDDGFDTPTLLGTAETAPYFHDGRFATLADVVAWFDRSFGLGLGAGGQADLTAYLTAVGASDRTADDRPPAQIMIDSFVYLELLLDGDARDDRCIWTAALEASRDELARHPETPAVAPAIARARQQVAALLARAQAGASLAPLRPEAATLRRDLFRLAADWAGALDAAASPSSASGGRMKSKGLLITSKSGSELGRQTYEDDGQTLRSDIHLAGHHFSVTIDRVRRRATVKEGTTEVTRDVPPGTLALENGDWQAYALAAEQYADARTSTPVKVLLPGQGVTLDGMIRVTARPDGTRHVELSISPITVEVDVGADGSVTSARIPLQSTEVRAESWSTAATPPHEARRAPPAGVAEEPVVVERGGVGLRGVLWRPAQVTGRMPIALIIGGSGPTDRDGNQGGRGPDSYRLLAAGLARAGIASIRYDKRGIGDSDRVSEASLSFTDLVEDAAAFAALARKDERFTKLTVVGHSEGGLVAIMLGSAAPHPDALVLLATPGRPLWQVIHEQLAFRGKATDQADAIMTALRDGKPVPEYPRELARLFRPSVEKFLRSVIALDPAALLAKVSIPVAIVQGETDVQVSVADARLLFAKQQNIRLWLLPRVNHVLKEEATLSPKQDSYTAPSRPLGPGVVDAVATSIAR